MIWLKSIFLGFTAALATVIATTMWHFDAGERSGGVGFVSFGLSGLLLFPAALAFALGIRWMVRRHHRVITRPTPPTPPTRPN